MITLAEISALAKQLIAKDRSVEEAELALNTVKEEARFLREETLPMAMAELELKEFKLDTGEKIGVKQEVYASIPAANKPDAFSWLEEHGFGGLIKTEVGVSFGRGELDAALQLESQLLEQGLKPETTRDVHSQTLRAFLREQLEAGNAELPLELFGARPVWTAKVTAAKK